MRIDWRVPSKRKSPELRIIDEAEEKEEDTRYFRLDPEEGTSDEQVVVKLDAPDATVRKLDFPKRQDVETRSNEPNVEDLITVNRPTLEETEAEWGKAAAERRPVPWGWFVLLGLAIAGVSIWSISNVRDAEEQLDTIRLGTETILDMEQTSIVRARHQIERIHESLIAFSEAPDVETMAGVVRQPERVRPLMDDHYSRHGFEPLGRPRVEILRPLTLGQHGDFWMATVSFGQSEKRNLIIQAGAEGDARIDWETVVCYQPMPWDDYVRARPHGTTMDFRVYLEPDSLYSHEFRDSALWDCYKLTALDSEEVLFGYIRSDNPSAELFRQWFRRYPSGPASMILRLSLPDGLTSPRGVVIDHALSVRWIYIVPPTGDS